MRLKPSAQQGPQSKDIAQPKEVTPAPALKDTAQAEKSSENASVWPVERRQ